MDVSNCRIFPAIWVSNCMVQVLWQHMRIIEPFDSMFLGSVILFFGTSILCSIWGLVWFSKKKHYSMKWSRSCSTFRKEYKPWWLWLIYKIFPLSFICAIFVMVYMHRKSKILKNYSIRPHFEDQKGVIKGVIVKERWHPQE